MNTRHLITAVLCLILFHTASVLAETETVTPAVDDALGMTEQAESVATKVNKLVVSIAEQRKRLDEFNSKLRTAKGAEEKRMLEEQAQEINKRLGSFRGSLEQIVIGGLDLDVLSDAPPEKIHWQSELEQIAMPVLAGLRELTAKPRRIEGLRTDIERHREQLEVIELALDSIAVFENAELSEGARKRVSAIAADWRAKDAEIRQSLDVALFQLTNLTGQDVSWSETLKDAFDDFIRGRGLTLLLAIIIGFAVWLILRGLLHIYRRLSRNRRGRSRTIRLRVVEFAYRAFTVVVVTLAVMSVFYVRSDLLLLALSLIIVISVLVWLRQMIPLYIKETKLLLGVGSVREGERVVIDGIPLRTDYINMYTMFSNPSLTGARRLPLAALDDMISRPSDNEDWFPTEKDDYVLLADGAFGQVIDQTVDFVRIRVAKSPVTLPTVDFLTQGVRNLSREGFAVSVTFGIDYCHQSIALNEVPKGFRAGVLSMLADEGVAAQVRDVVVEFKEAAASSLNYHIWVVFDGSIASLYFKLIRILQRACVSVCNEQGWGIPFDQLTLHQGEGFARLNLDSEG